MLFFDRPFKIGDSINIEKLWGVVQDIGIRSTRLRTFDGKFVTIPNSKIAKSIITNVSVFEGRRLDLTVGVDYDTDLKKAKKAIERAVRKLERKGMIKEEPKPRTFVNSFGDSSIDFKIIFWYNTKYVKEHDMWFKEVKGELIDAIKREFEKEKITIPFPQVTLSERRKKKV
jgi:small-conductance mechanosensitive channel